MLLVSLSFPLVFSTTFSQKSPVVPFDTLSISCLVFATADEPIVISALSQYKQLEWHKKGAVCAEWPQIDFEKKILVGHSIQFGGCRDPITETTIRQVGGDFLATMKIHENGVCRMLIRKTYWFILDKPTQDNFKISFTNEYN